MKQHIQLIERLVHEYRAVIAALFLGLLIAIGISLALRNAGDHAHNIPPNQATLAPMSVSTPPPASITGQLRDTLAAALGHAADASAPERIHLLQTIPGDLSEAEATAVLSELLAHPTLQTSPSWHAEYIHNLCSLLQRRTTGHEDFARGLATLADDATRPIVIRDYAIQHLVRLWAAAPDDVGAGISATLRNLAHGHGRGDPVAAPALLALHLLGPPGRFQSHMPDAAPPAIPDDQIIPLLDGILMSPSHTPSAIAAIRIVAERKLTTHHQALRGIVSNPHHPAILRAAAIGAIASSPSVEDTDLLATISDEGHPLLTSALIYARQAPANTSR